MYTATTTIYHPRSSPPSPPPPPTCSQGHRSTLLLTTTEGGTICLLCLSNLFSNPKSPTVHVSYALSQLSLALAQPQFLHGFLTYHSHFLISPLIQVLSAFDDEPIANQTTDLIVNIIEHADDEVYGEFVSRVSDKLSSGSLAWSRKKLYMLHCMGRLLDFDRSRPSAYVKDKYALVFNLVTGLQLFSEEIQGEIFFLLYKLSVLQQPFIDDDWTDLLSASCPKLLHLSLEALMKTQSDDVRLNCVVLLKVLAQRGLLTKESDEEFFEPESFMQTTEQIIDRPPLNILFAEAIKGPLLSSDSQVQVAALDLIVSYLSCEGDSGNCQVLVEENIADYVFEVLRLSGCKDSLINSCIAVLDLLSTAEQSFRLRLAIGFTTLVSVLHYMVDIPFHPFQTLSMKLISNCISNCPGAVSSSHVEEIGVILTRLLKKHVDGGVGMLPETFILACSILVSIMKCSCSSGSVSLLTSIQDSTKDAVLICLSDHLKHPGQILHSLHLVKDAYAYSHEVNPTSSLNSELRDSILDVCTGQLLPWFLMTAYDFEDEEIMLAVLETFHSILLQNSDPEVKIFTNNLITSSWFSISFGCLGIFPTEKMRWRIYLVLSSITDVLLGNNFGQLIRDAASDMPSDPIDLLFLLGQKTSHNPELISCQSAILLIFYISSLNDDRLADVKLVLASLEQYILLNSDEFRYGASAAPMLEILVSLYGLCRGLAMMSYQIPYSLEAERTLFQLLDERDWDLLNTRIHVASLKWLFQQEKMCKSLSDQLLKLCKCNSSNQSCLVIHEKKDIYLDINELAELVAAGDNYAPLLLVCLLGDAIQDNQEDDIISVVTTITKLIEILPAASNQLSANGIGDVVQKLFPHSTYSSSSDVRMGTYQLVLCLLSSVSSDSISDYDAWVAIVTKLVDCLLHSVSSEGWTQETLLALGIMSLVLHHSTSHALVEASKSILLNSPLISMINSAICEACSKGPALADHIEGTRTGDILVCLLLLLFFSLRSVCAILPGILDCNHFFEELDKMQPLSHISIHCHDLCKLLHYGSPVVKLLASHCLVELFSIISEHKTLKLIKLRIRTGYLSSVMAILEGFLFFKDSRVSLNCALCLSIIMLWEELNIELLVPERNQWCRLVVEEMVMSFAAFTVHHKPAVHIAVALLRMSEVPKWLSSVLDSSCISGIIENLSPSNLTAELVVFFRELLVAGYLKADQIASVNRIFQSCRKHVYTEEIQDLSKEEQRQEIEIGSDDIGQVCKLLFRLMFHQSSDPKGLQNRDLGLSEQIVLFSKHVMEYDEN